MNQRENGGASFVLRDTMAGVVVFLVALPLCLGVAKASDAPYISGILAGIVGGLVVGFLSGSHTSVAGPAAGLTAVVSAQIVKLGSFESFLLALVIGGLVQAGFGLAKLGEDVAYIPLEITIFNFMHGSKVTGYSNSVATNGYADLASIGVEN